MGMTVTERERAEGFKEGREKGLEEGRKTLVERLLRTKFGEIPATVQARLDSASGSDLDRWGDRILTASKLEEVFA